MIVDEDDTFVNAVGGNKAPLNGEIIQAGNIYSDVEAWYKQSQPNEALLVVGDCS